MVKYFVVSTRRVDGPEFEVLSFDAATKRANLKGKYGAIFNEDISAETLKNMGYKLEKREVADHA